MARCRVALLFLLAAALWDGAPLVAQSATAETEISGTSTVRNWTCEVGAAVELEPGQPGAEVPGFPEGVRALNVTVPVLGIECPEDEMEDHLREAMMAEEYPTIVYRLDEYTVESDQTVQMNGTMTITDTTNPVQLKVTVDPGEAEARVEGETSLDMTEYEIEPPRVILGMLRVGAVVRIRFGAAVRQPSR